jgi:hypothetical protein
MIRKTILLHKYSPSVFCWIRVAHLFSFLCCVVFLCFVCRHPVYPMLPISLDCPFLIASSFLTFPLPVMVSKKQNFVQKINIFFKYDFFYLLSNHFYKMGFNIHSYSTRIYGMHTDIINYFFQHMT